VSGADRSPSAWSTAQALRDSLLDFVQVCLAEDPGHAHLAHQLIKQRSEKM